MMTTVPHVTSGFGLRKFQADGFLLTRVYREQQMYFSLQDNVVDIATKAQDGKCGVRIPAVVRDFSPPQNHP